MVESFADQLNTEQIAAKQQEQQSACIWKSLVIEEQPNPDCKVIKPNEVIEKPKEEKKQTLKFDQQEEWPMGIEEHKIALVIDANVLIKQISLRELMGAKDDKEFSEQYEVYTIDEVIAEIKDQSARQFITGGTLPFELKTESAENIIEKNDQYYVDNFSRETGDFATLS